MAIRLFETLTQRLVVVDLEYILVQSCSVVVDLVHTLILSSVVMNLILHIPLRNRLVNQILQVSIQEVFCFNSISQSVLHIKFILIS